MVVTASLSESGDHDWFVEALADLHGMGWGELDVLDSMASRGTCWRDVWAGPTSGGSPATTSSISLRASPAPACLRRSRGCCARRYTSAPAPAR